ncbi:LOB domain-containing protein [Artemisia annua]|uniref:LOB domain-containing protein n=1 Tax=Artemisia annua TaxID=35608 RepID=A0A2U1PCJ7_ARTAN|nr:LOB domain-containing protein [Artemisia annua]
MVCSTMLFRVYQGLRNKLQDASEDVTDLFSKIGISQEHVNPCHATFVISQEQLAIINWNLPVYTSSVCFCCWNTRCLIGASNVSMLLHHGLVVDRCEAVAIIAYEALAGIKDPVYGCVCAYFALQQ